MIDGRPDEQRLDGLDRASEESEPRGSGFVGERLGRQAVSIDNDRRPGERLIALADHANGNFGRDGAQRQQRPDRRHPRRQRHVVGTGQQRVAFDDQMWWRSRAQSLRLGLVDLGHHHLAYAAAIGREGLRATELDALENFDVLLMTEVVDDAVHGELGTGERPATGRSSGAY